VNRLGLEVGLDAIHIKRIWVLLISTALLTVTLLKQPGLADDKARDRKTLQCIRLVAT
jgi:hypothetical protein